MKDDSLLINTLASNNHVTGMASKMASMLSQNWLTFFFAKKLKILYISYHVSIFKFHLHVVQILIKYMEGFQTSNVSVSNGNTKCPIGKSIFAVNLTLKLFRATVANSDTGSLKSLHALFVWILVEILGFQHQYSFLFFFFFLP